MVSTWLLGFVLGIVFLQLLMMYLYAGHDENDPPLAPSPDDATTPTTSTEIHADTDTDTDANATTCSACGTENAVEYRYCRQCVGDLSGDSVPEHRRRSPASRLF